MKKILGAVLIVAVLAGISPTASATHELPAPVAHWKLDETSGTTAFDETANNNDGTLCGNGVACIPPGGPTVGVAGHFGTAYSFDRVNDYVEIPDSASFAPSEFTISLWVNWDGTSSPDNQRGIITKRTTDNEWHLLVLNNGAVQFVAWSSNPVIAVGSTTTAGALAPGQWTHIAVAQPVGENQNILRIYVNGVLAMEGLIVGSIQNTGNAIRFGERGLDPDRFFGGLMDDVRFYDQAVTAAQAMDLFLEPAHHYCTALSSAHAINSIVQAAAVPLIMFAVTSAIIASVVLGYNWRMGGGRQ